MKSSFRVLNALYLKIIGTVLMVIDHIGMFFLHGDSLFIMRCIGRSALPIFIFLAIESLYKSRNVLRYCFSMIIPGILFDLIMYFFDKSFMGNIFIDLGLGVLTCYLLRKKNAFSLLALLPAAYLVLSNLYPKYIHSEYGLYGLLCFLITFIVYEVIEYAEKSFANKNNLDIALVKDAYDRNIKNISAFLSFLLVNVIFYAIYRLDNFSPLIPFSFNIQSYAVIGSLLFIFYSGDRGFKSKVLQYSFYAFYPLHLLLFYGIRLLII